MLTHVSVKRVSIDIFFIVNDKGQPIDDLELAESLQREICEQLDRRVDRRTDDRQGLGDRRTENT